MSVEAPDIIPYLSIIPDRSPRQKAHVNIGLAKKAVLYRLHREKLSTPCKVYHWTAKGWEILWDIKEGTHREEMPWHRTDSPKN